MAETTEHIMLKQLVADYMRARNWHVETEFTISINGDFRQNNGKGPGRNITVDVFATKNGKEYVCEVGRITEEKRMELLDYVFDTADHIQLDFKNCRRKGYDFEGIESVEYSYSYDGNKVEKKKRLFRGPRGFM